jgi:hypothetical protein
VRADHGVLGDGQAAEDRRVLERDRDAPPGTPVRGEPVDAPVGEPDRARRSA